MPAITALCVCLGTAGCGGSGDPSPPAGTTSKAAKLSGPKQPGGHKSAGHGGQRPGAKVSVQATSYGTIVADGRGRTLYLFTREQSPRSR